MLSLAHTIISIPFGIIFQNPLLAFLSAFIMHFICDRFLHWNIYPHKMPTYPFIWIAFDVVLGLGLAYLIAGNTVFTISILAAILGGNMPDILHAFWSMLTIHQKKVFPRFITSYFNFHESIQRETDSIPRGLISQIVLGIIAIIITRILI
ncbi:MAG TPA: hypothetical protein VLG69_00175 [Candidatus Andersenbacteria bacterium]|nr:hypothetical protein [Candidatus Andersenbacteria bacterium]